MTDPKILARAMDAVNARLKARAKARLDDDEDEGGEAEQRRLNGAGLNNAAGVKAPTLKGDVRILAAAMARANEAARR